MLESLQQQIVHRESSLAPRELQSKFSPQNIGELPSRCARHDDHSIDPCGEPPQRDDRRRTRLGDFATSRHSDTWMLVDSAQQLRLPMPWLNAENLASESNRIVPVPRRRPTFVYRISLVFSSLQNHRR
jgi:hypothetical protein